MRRFIEKQFQLESFQTDIKTELVAGFTTFVTMAYVLATIPNMLEAGGYDKHVTLSVMILLIMIDSASEDIKDDLKVTRIPLDNVPGSVSNSLHIPASISDEEKELVWEFIKMVAEDDFQQLYMEKVGSPSPNKNAATDELLEQNPFLGQFIEDAENAQEILPSGYEEQYGEFTQFVIDSAMAMTTDPYVDVETSLNELKNKVESELTE